MPTYDYECLKCKKTFEAFQPITAPLLKKCKYCSGKVKRLIGAGGGIIFKGKGFYATDYRKGDYKEKKKSEMPSVCPSDGKGCQCCPKTRG